MIEIPALKKFITRRYYVIYSKVTPKYKILYHEVKDVGIRKIKGLESMILKI